MAALQKKQKQLECDQLCYQAHLILQKLPDSKFHYKLNQVEGQATRFFFTNIIKVHCHPLHIFHPITSTKICEQPKSHALMLLLV